MKKPLLILVALCASASAHAQWEMTGGYATFESSIANTDFRLNQLVAGFGYRIDRGVALSFMPQMRAGYRSDDEAIFGALVEIESFIAFSFRGQYDFDSGVYLYVAPTYANTALRLSAGGQSITDQALDFGISGGFGYRLTDNVMGEVFYETYDNIDVIGLAVRYGFVF